MEIHKWRVDEESKKIRCRYRYQFVVEQIRIKYYLGIGLIESKSASQAKQFKKY